MLPIYKQRDMGFYFVLLRKSFRVPDIARTTLVSLDISGETNRFFKLSKHIRPATISPFVGLIVADNYLICPCSVNIERNC